MTSTVERRRLFPDLVSERPAPLHARLRAFLLWMWRPRRAGIAWLLPVVVAGSAAERGLRPEYRALATLLDQPVA